MSANDCLVENFLQKKIKFLDISKILFRILKKKEFQKYKLKKPTNSVPGLLVFSHKEYLKFLNTKVAKFLLDELKENYFIHENGISK